jgi:sirohydrochlorin ferrochelatase
MAHGGDEAWNQNVEASLAPIAAKWPVEVAYGMAVSSSLEDGVARLEARGVRKIAVVRLFVSGDSWFEETQYIFGLKSELSKEKLDAHAAIAHHGHGAHGGHKMEAPRPISKQSKVMISEAGLGDSPLVDGILADRVKALSSNPQNETVLILAHGPGDDAENERWLANMRERLRAVGELGAFRKIEVETLREDWPDKRKAAEERIRGIVSAAQENGGEAIVVPFRVSGFGPYKQVLEGLTYKADETGFLPHANVTRWIDETATTLLKD